METICQRHRGEEGDKGKPGLEYLQTVGKDGFGSLLLGVVSPRV